MNLKRLTLTVLLIEQLATFPAIAQVSLPEPTATGQAPAETRTESVPPIVESSTTEPVVDASSAIAPTEVSPTETATVGTDSDALLDPVAAAPIVDNEPPAITGSDVFLRIRNRLNANTCKNESSDAKRWRNRYAHSPTVFAEHLRDILPLLNFVSLEVEQLNLPAELVFIPLVESWYRPDAMGKGGPAGMWQMISSTARNHGIRIQANYDGRLSPVESTRAALSYLKTLQADFNNDWQAMVMAYNAGENRLQKAFKRAGSRTVMAAQKKPHGLSNVTYDYVAKLQALSCLIAIPERQRLSLPSNRFTPLAPVLMAADVATVDQFAVSQGLDKNQLRKLNPGFKGGVIAKGVPRLIMVPYLATIALAAAEATQAKDSSNDLANDLSSHVDGTFGHRVTSGETLWSIARRYGVNIEQLRKFNGLGIKAVIKPGQWLKLSP